MHMTLFQPCLRSRWLLLSACALALSACGSVPETRDGAGSTEDRSSGDFGSRIVQADKEPENWLSYGRDYQETRYSPLDQIGHANIRRLGLNWAYDLDTDRGQESTPLVVDGIIYSTSAWSKVQAIDGVSGKLLWQFDPEVPGETAAKGCCDVVNRGAAYWDGKLYVGTLDGRLIAIDARTGRQIWSTLTVDAKKPYTITGAPRVIKGRVIIGNAGAEFGVRGYVSAYDAETGRLGWRFYTVPGKPGVKDGAASDDVLARLAAQTWSGDSWRRTNGGGTVWDSMSYDPALDLLYIGVGNGGWYPTGLRSPASKRNNDNLFLASVVALRPETGEYVWHFQETPGDQWDYTSTQHMILTDLKIDGRQRKVLIHAPKNGFFYVIDREDGRLISARPYARVNWATGIDQKTGRPLLNPAADYSKTGKEWIGFPSSGGAHSWQPMAMSPRTGLVYIPVRDAAMPFAIDRSFQPKPLGLNVGLDMSGMAAPDTKAEVDRIRRDMTGYLLAWDPVRQKEVWRVRLAGDWNGGVLATGGDLVFQGDMDGYLRAYDARNGAPLWSFDAQSAISAPPITWAKDGRQYVTVVAGWGTSAGLGFGVFGWGRDGPRRNHSRVLTFSLDATGKLPALPKEPRRELPPVVPRVGTASDIAAGKIAYNRTCFACHGAGAIGGGVVPDLRYSAAIEDAALWQSIVADGALASRGMIGFKANFSSREIEQIRAYVVNAALRSKY